MEVFMDIAKGHELHKIWTLLMSPKKRAEDCSKQCGSCKPIKGKTDKRHAICIKDWVCFDTSADHFWTLNSFAMCTVLTYDLARGQAHNQRSFHDAEPIREQGNF